MANQLKMAMVHAILTLARLGWSQRRIAGELGIDRETVARYVHAPPADSKPATNPIPGSEPLPEAIAGAKRVKELRVFVSLRRHKSSVGRRRGALWSFRGRSAICYWREQDEARASERGIPRSSGAMGGK
jgi:transcriptional regulator with XRE-family HTH domain